MEAIQVDSLNYETTHEPINKGCRNMRFVKSFIKKLVRDYYQLIERAQIYICLDDEKQTQKAKIRDKKRLSNGRGLPGDRRRERF